MPVHLNIGCGEDIRDKNDGWINYDVSPINENVTFLDLEEAKLPHEDDSVDSIRANHVLEHVWNWLPLVNDCWRVLKKDGSMYIEVPKFPHEDSVKDPTHVRFFADETFVGYLSNYPKGKLFPQYKIKPWDIVDFFSDDHLIRTVMRPNK